MCFLAAQYRTGSPKQVSFSLSRGSLLSILYLSLFHSLSLFSHSLWRSPFSPDLEAVWLESNVMPGNTGQPGWRPPSHRAAGLLSSFSLSLHYDVKRGDRGSTTVGRGPRLLPPEATEVVEWVLRHFFWPN
jgi:hypothetical protein